MIDLNDFLKEVKSGKIKKDNIMVICREGLIVDYLLPGESINENDVIETKSLKAIVSEIFEIY